MYVTGSVARGLGPVVARISPHPKQKPPEGCFCESEGPAVRQRPSAAMPALAICTSSLDFTPLTPTAPIT